MNDHAGRIFLHTGWNWETMNFLGVKERYIAIAMQCLYISTYHKSVAILSVEEI